ncbi:MAG: Gfo/Idh/MocA family oxidoreductase [Planctomycetales bacterium]|nr:Gfo/Idh/MocA family oxidoreductase [Planctomycetales bacterium]
MNRLRTAVVGCGHLGRIHAQLLQQLPDAELVAVVDPNELSREKLAEQLAVPALDDYQQLVGKIDAAVIAAPTFLHFEIAQNLLAQGIHLLVEKPLAVHYSEAAELARLAKHNQCLLAVGHVERFNPAFTAVQAQQIAPRYIEARRAGGFTFRSLDVGVVMDLMIHDLELVLALVDSPIAWVSAVGLPFVTSHEDVAEARVVFTNGCTAEFRASRISPEPDRSMSIYTDNEQYLIDFGKRNVRVLQRHEAIRNGLLQVERLTPAETEELKAHVFDSLLPCTELDVAEANPLLDELQDFVQSVRNHTTPRVNGSHAADAVWLAEEILRQMQSNRQHADGSHGRRAA